MVRLISKERGAVMRPLLFLLGIAGSAALAADSDGNFAIKGAGLQTCENFLAAYSTRSTDLGLYSGWIDGFLTGQNQYREGVFDLASWETSQILLALTQSSCAQVPPETLFIDGFAQVLRLIRPDAITEQDTASAAKLGDRVVVLYDDVMIRMKVALAAAGYTPGDVTTATFTNEAASALKAFQADKGIIESGLPDQRTLYELFRR